MRILQKNRRGIAICDKCNKEIEFGEDYFWETDTGEIICENCNT